MNELEQAIITIKQECEKHGQCCDCPLRQDVGDNNGCAIDAKRPDKWKLRSEIPDFQPSIFA